jgi:hypothetical protein
MKPIKVAHLSSVHALSGARILPKECKSLANAGYEVTFVLPHDEDGQLNGVKIKALPKPAGRLSRMTKTVWQVFREAARKKADVYHFHDPELIPVGLLLRILGKKVIYDIHEDLPKHILSKDYVPGGVRRPLAWLVERVENAASGHFSALVAATSAIAERFRALNCNTVVVHNFAVLDEFTVGLQASWSERTRL